MKAKGVLMLGVVAALVAPMGAQAETKKVVRLARTVQALRKQVATTEKQLAAARKKALAARRRAVQLTDTLTQVNAALSASQSEVSSLQAELAAIPEPLSEAVSVVQREVAWSGPQPYSVGEMTALAAVDYTVGHVSAGVYGYQEEQGLTLPDWEPDVILRQGAGICGQSAAVFVGIMQRLGYQVRSVQFYFTNPDGSADTHVAVEVYYDGGWHFFDPTYAAYWSSDTSGNVLPISDIRAGAGTMHKDAMTFTNIVGDADSSVASQNDIWFETDPTTQVVVGAISWYPY
jgi:transglutaminase superfamily protein